VARAIFEKWELDFAIVGRVTDTGRLVLKMHGRTWCDLEIAPLFDAAPLYHRPTEPTPEQAEVAASSVPLPDSVDAVLLRLMTCPDLASKRWIWEQYDSQVGADTRFGPGGDAAVVRVHGTPKALAMTSDVTPRYCLADPKRGGAQAVAEAWRNLTAVGAVPLALTDNMNFGNPEKPRIMGQFAGCVEGMAEACSVLSFPVVSGNVSLYNETNGEGILPTPTIGGVGLLKDAGLAIGSGFVREGEAILLVGATAGHVGQSLYLREIHGREDGAPPPVDLGIERRNGDFVRGLIEARIATACHDVSDGGLLVAATEMAMRGGIGADLPGLAGTDPGLLFGEDQGRYLVTVPAEAAGRVLDRAKAAGIPVTRIGTTGGDALTGLACGPISVEAVRQANEAWLPGYMADEL
jgi:phosphoribosylformylglycinamidine synthase